MNKRINLVGKRIQAERPDIQAKLSIGGDLKVEAAKEENGLPTFTMLAYTGAVIGQGWGQTIVELSGMTFPQVIPILADHDSSRPVGHSTKITMTDKGLEIQGVISGDPQDESVRRIVAMGKNGFPWQASIGASIEKVEYNEGKSSWLILREKNDIERLLPLFAEAALRMDAPSQVLWEHFLAYYREHGDTTFDFDSEDACRFMNRVFRQPALSGYLVNLDENEFKVVDKARATEEVASV